MMSPNEKNKLKLRQICFIFIAFMPVTKLALLPSTLAKYCDETLWQSVIISILLDVITLIVAFILCKKHRNSTLFYILENQINKPVAKIIYFGYGVYFLLKALVPHLEQQDYINNTLYELTPSVLVFLPLFIVSFYQSLKGLKILGRCADACMFVTIIGILLVLALSIPILDFTNLLPIIQKPTYKPVNGAFRTIIWYQEAVYILLFLGHFEVEKHQGVKVVSSYLFGGLIVFIFVIFFYAGFGSIASSRTFALSEIANFSTIDSARFDYIAIFLLMFSQVFAIILPVYLSTKCFERAFGLNKSLIPAIVINLTLAIFTVIFTGKLYEVLNFISNYLVYVFIFFGYILPIILLFIPNTITAKGEKYEKT